MPKVYLIAMVACTAACAVNPKPMSPDHVRQPDARTVAHVLNRAGFGPRPGDIQGVQALGLRTYLEEQLHPERMTDAVVQPQLDLLSGLRMSARAFATDYYLPMVAARLEFTDAQKASAGPTRPTHLGWHLLPVAAVSLPGGDKPVSVIQQPAIIPEELAFQRENQKVFDELQAQKLLRAVYGERQLQEVLTDFWFNHFNVDARKIEDRPVMVEYERDVIRPRVFGRFHELLEATATSPAMLFYLDNWLSTAAQKGPAPGRGLNENYGRELLELHTLGVD